MTSWAMEVVVVLKAEEIEKLTLSEIRAMILQTEIEIGGAKRDEDWGTTAALNSQKDLLEKRRDEILAEGREEKACAGPSIEEWFG